MAINSSAINVATINGTGEPVTPTATGYMALDAPLYDASILGGGVAGILSANLTDAAILTWSNYMDLLTVTDTVQYILYLTDATSTTTQVPMESWQATMRLEFSGEAEIEIPNMTDWGDAVVSAVTYEVQTRLILSGVAHDFPLFSGEISRIETTEDENSHRARMYASLEALTTPAAANPVYDNTLVNQRSVFSGPRGYRVRCALDPNMRPGHTAYINDATSFMVDTVTYYADGTNVYMDVYELFNP